MIETWILIMWINGGNGNTAIFSQEFWSESKCQQASIDIIIKNKDYNVQQNGGAFSLFTVCVKK